MSEQASDEKTPDESTDDEDDEEAAVDDHLQDVEAGAGCTEIWEHLSERRDENE